MPEIRGLVLVGCVRSVADADRPTAAELAGAVPVPVSGVGLVFGAGGETPIRSLIGPTSGSMMITFENAAFTDNGALSRYLGRKASDREPAAPESARKPRSTFADQARRPRIIIMRAAAAGTGTHAVQVSMPGQRIVMPSTSLAASFLGVPGRPKPRAHHSSPASMPSAHGYPRRLRTRRRRSR